MRRREFITLLGGTAAWPLAARGQQSERMRLIGALLPIAKDDPEYQPWIGAFRQALQELGWIEGRNMRLDIRWATANPGEIRKEAAELAALAPDVILAPGSSTVGPLMQATSTVPIVFPIIADPVAGAQFGAIQAVAPMLRLEVSAFNKRDANEIEHAITAFAQSPNGGLILTAGGPAFVHRDLIISLAARYKLPAVYYERFFVAAGGLLSYGPDRIDMYQRAAGYVDRILKGEKPADIPVQAPTKYQLVINLKTAKALGLDVPAQLHQIADEVIE